MRASASDFLAVVLITVVSAYTATVRESSAAALAVGALVGLVSGGLFCALVHIVSGPLRREVGRLQDRVAELERRSGGSGPPAP